MKFTWGQKVVVTSGFNCGLVGEIRNTYKFPFQERRYYVCLNARHEWFHIKESNLTLSRDLNKPAQQTGGEGE